MAICYGREYIYTKSVVQGWEKQRFTYKQDLYMWFYKGWMSEEISGKKK